VRALRVLAVCGGIVAVVLALAVPASAHAVLRSAVPADGQQLDAPPREIRLEFTEPVTLADDALRVHNANAAVVPLGPLADDGASGVRAPFVDPLPEGSYIVTWRVVSADGHPISGGLVFSVGAGEQIDAALVRQVFASGSARPAAVAAVVIRSLGYLCVLVAAGGVAFLVWAADPRDGPALQRSVRLAAVVGVAAAVLAVPVQAAESSGAGVRGLLRADLLATAITGGVGVQSLVQVLALGAVAFLLRGRAEQRYLWAVSPAAVAAAAVVVAGHTRTTQPVWLVVGSDVLHVLAAAIWVGGLVLLWPAARRRWAADDPTGAARTVARFSSVATAAVIAVGVAGALLSWMLVRTGTALTSTAYGRVLLAKVLLVLVVLAVGAYNNRRLVPAVAAATAAQPGVGSGPPDAVPAWRRLRRTIRAEVIVLAVVMAVTATLVGLRPAAEAAGVTAPFSTVVPVGDDAQLHLTVDPNHVGNNALHLYVLDATGRPVDATGLELRMTLPANGIGPLARTPTFVAPGHWVHTGNDLVAPGRWHIEALVTIGRFEQHRANVSVEVRP
jgi:copper transport protein